MNITDATATHKLLQLAYGCALGAAAVVAGFFVCFWLFGPAASQDPLQVVLPVEQYQQLLLDNPTARRLAIGLDNVFMALYSTLFVVIGCLLKPRNQSPLLYTATFVLLVLLGGLDLLENMHFLTMLAAAERGVEVSATQIQLQVWESLVKFHVGYLGLFLLSWILPRTTRLERAFCFALRWVQLPVGMLIYVAPPQLATPLLTVRALFFLFSLLAQAAILRRWQSDSSALQ